jgi:putative membrane protein
VSTNPGGRASISGRVQLAIVVAGFVGLGIAPAADRLTWLLENAPVLIGLPIIVATQRGFPLSPVVRWLLVVHALVLMIGGHYSYAEVPAGRMVSDALGLARNHYDRLGHFMQGFVPAMLLREILLRTTGLARGKMAFTVILFMCLGFSAFYELIEWWTAVWTADGASAFLGTQGDVWDTQWDMFLCGCGAALAQLLLASTQDHQLLKMNLPP